MSETIRSTTRLIKIIMAFSVVGIVLDLLLIGHYEDWRQLLPVVCLPVALLLAYLPGSKLKVLYYISLIVMLVGIVGVVLHLANNYEFEQEMRPNLAGAELMMRAFTGALPVMAPGALIPIGLIGLLLKKLNTKT